MGNTQSNTDERESFDLFNGDDDNTSFDIYESAKMTSSFEPVRNFKKLIVGDDDPQLSQNFSKIANFSRDRIQSQAFGIVKHNTFTKKRKQQSPIIGMHKRMDKQKYSTHICKKQNMGNLTLENRIEEFDRSCGLPVNSVAYLEKQSWFFTGLTRKDANVILYKNRNPPGSFLIRPSDTYIGNFNLAVKDGKRICHYLLRRLNSGHFLSSVRLTFPNLLEFITYYVDGLKPCIDSVGDKKLKRQNIHLEIQDTDDNATRNVFLQQPYYYGDMNRYDAETLLLEEGKDGRNLYLIRKSQSYKDVLVLSIKEGHEVSHVLLPECSPKENKLIVARKHVEFNSLCDVVDYYSTQADGLCAKLTTPAIVK